ncbi:MAG: hypothetical protein GY809_14750 [Planctomycetes bacterium]|nr:hypothetical protein [Planctomycetota bacterium]
MAAVFFILLTQARANILINEFMAINGDVPIGLSGDFDDWIELYNDSNEPVDVGGFYLTDDLSNPTQWQFPTDNARETTIGPRGFLLIMADNDPTSAGLHTNFKLASRGEDLALFDAHGIRLLDSVTFGPQQVNMSYGRDFLDPTQWRFLSWPSPGASNLPGYEGAVADPVFSHQRGFYEEPFSVTLTCDTPDVTLVYSTDGSDPQGGAGSDARPYGEPIPVARTLCLRAVATKPGWAPSRVVSHTFLFRESPRIKSLPVLSLVGSDGQTFYAPDGVMAIVGGRYNGGVWSANSPNSYNNVLTHGLERPVSLEVFDSEGATAYQTDCGIRVHGSAWMRPRYTSSSKFSFRLYFRSEYGLKALHQPFFPFDVAPLRSVVLRGGHNDQTNPFIKDELVRRLLNDMGHVSSRGTFVNLFINGRYKGYYNPCEHITESFCQGWFESDQDWDIITMFGEVREGDRTRADALMQYVRTHDLSDAQHYAEVDRQVDIVEFIDYLILRLWSGDWDWPQNNWSAASERSDQGRWRFFVWDAEGSMFSDRLNTVRYDTLHNNNHENATLYNALRKSPQFRTLYGDRVNKHLFNQGVLTEDHIKARFADMQDEMSGVIPNMDQYAVNTWAPKRHSIFLDASRAEGVFNEAGPMPFMNGTLGTPSHVLDGDQLLLINSKASGTIYYTTDGSDPMVHAEVDDWDSVTLVPIDAPKRVWVPTDDSVTEWTGAGAGFFDDSAWLSSEGLPGGVGFDRNTEYDPFISLHLDAEMQSSAGCYVRVPFVASRTLNTYDVLLMRIQYDDGFVAYLNGQEVARRNVTGDPAWNTTASASRNDTGATLFETIDLSAFLPHMRRAENILAIHGMNVSARSSDFLISVELTAGKGTPIEIDETLQLYETPIPLTQATHIKARILGNNQWSSLTDVTLAMQSVLDSLRITEVMYHPSDTGYPDDPNTEYIELMNTSDHPISLGLVQFTRGIRFDLPAMALEPKATALVVKDMAAFQNRYGMDLPVLGEYMGSLSNSGEWIELRDAADHIIHRLQYQDDWYEVTDGDGYSLTVNTPEQIDSEMASDKNLWRPSLHPGGTPGWVE